MNRIRIVFALTLASCLAPIAWAAQDYKCQIERAVTAAEDGTQFYAVYVGREFSVDRRTGVMVGAMKNDHGRGPEVLDAGSPSNSFKAVTVFRREDGVGYAAHAYILTIKEFVPSPEKPFMFAFDDVAIFGTCVHF